MNRINLISADLVVPAKIKSLKALLLKVNLILSIALTISLLLVVGLYFYFSLELKKVDSSVISLKSVVTSLETSEQRFVLVKDKLGKIAKLKKDKSITNNLIQIKALSSLFLNSSDILFNEMNIDIDKMEISIFAKTSDSLTLILSEISKMTGFKKIILSSLGFNPSFGYTGEILFK